MVRERILLPLLGALVILLAPAPGAVAAGDSNAAANAAETRHLCARAIARAEAARDIPAQLLTAVSLAESGRWDADRQEKFAWPWTVMSGGEGRFFPTKAAAIAHVRALRARGVSNIDVGCLQVNLHYHPDAFADLATAFDPAANAAYASRFLADLYRETKSWSAALRRYHSSDYRRSSRYLARVIPLWNEARHAAAEARRAAVIAAHMERRKRQRERFLAQSR